MKSSNSNVNIGEEGATKIPALVPDEEEEIEIPNVSQQLRHTASTAATAATATAVVPLGGSPLTEEAKLFKVLVHLLAVQGNLQDCYKLSTTGTTAEESTKIKQLRNFLRKSCSVHSSAVQNKLIPQNAFSVLVHKETKEIIDSADSADNADSLHRADKHYLIVKNDDGAFYVSNQHIAASVMDVFESLVHQSRFFNGGTTPFTLKGVIESFKKYVIRTIAVTEAQVQKVLDANTATVNKTTKSIHARAASEKPFLEAEQLLATLSFDTPFAQAKANAMLERLQGVVGGSGTVTEHPFAQELQQQQQALVAQLESQLDAANNALTALETSHAIALQRLETECSDLKRDIDMLETERSESKRHIKTLETERSESKRHIKTLETELSEINWKLDGTIAKYEVLQNSSASEASEARKTIAQVQASRKTHEDLIKTLRSEIARLKRDLRLAQGCVDENTVPN